jgi:hypothetical protein
MFPFFSLSILDQLPLHRGAFHNAQKTSLETGAGYTRLTGQSTYCSEDETTRGSLVAGPDMTQKVKRAKLKAKKHEYQTRLQAAARPPRADPGEAHGARDRGGVHRRARVAAIATRIRAGRNSAVARD